MDDERLERRVCEPPEPLRPGTQLLLRPHSCCELQAGHGVETGVLERDGCELRETRDPRDILLVVGAPVGPGHDADDPHHLAPRGERNPHHRPDPPAIIELRRVPRPRLVVGDHHRLSGLPDTTADALAARQHHVVPAPEHAQADREPQGIPCGIDHVEVPVRRADERRRPRDDGLEQLIGIASREERIRGFVEGRRVLRAVARPRRRGRRA